MTDGSVKDSLLHAVDTLLKSTWLVQVHLVMRRPDVCN